MKRFQIAVIAALTMIVAPVLMASEDPFAEVFTEDFDRDQCSFTSIGHNRYYPLRAGYTTLFRGMEDDDGELVEITVRRTVLPEIETIDGVRARVVEEVEFEDSEVTDISRTYVAVCRETGAVWLFGADENVIDDGEVVEESSWRSGIDDARPGLLMPSMPLVGARHFIELAPGRGLDFAEIQAKGATRTVRAGEFDDVLIVLEGATDEEDEASEKWYAKGIGLIRDDALELIEYSLPPCMSDSRTMCLNHGRYKVQGHWSDGKGNGKDAGVRQLSNESGEMWFQSPDSVEVMVKVLDACSVAGFNNTWVFVSGLTNLEVVVNVTDTVTGQIRVYRNPLGVPFEPVLATAAFATCD